MLSKKHDSYESIRDERRYGPYWYSALWRIIRPILIGLGTVLVVSVEQGVRRVHCAAG